MMSFIARYQRNKRNLILIVTCTVLLGSVPLVPVPALAFWTCSPGYELQIRSSNNQHVRCFRPADNKDVDPKSCPQTTLPTGQKVGTGYVQDYYSDGRDACVSQDPTGTVKTAVAHDFCPGDTYSLNKRSGRDQCHRPADTKPPTVNVP
jgi:hypothetical protein